MSTKVLRDGYLYAGGDDGAIHRSEPGKVDTIAGTTFDAKDRGASMQVHCTVAGSLPSDVNWMEFSLTVYGEKRSKHASISINLEQVKRLRELCSVVLGEAS